MLFTKKNNKVIKIAKNDLIKSIKDTGAIAIHFMEPVDNSNVRIAKQELDKLVRSKKDFTLIIIE